ncbi:tRNA lysidine(34) synthetase TilS [Oceaniglobus roseus]|uniref:tRNA lysidine(34) synthetase TilS n=1 Tax=Oceaniglobus roseus TaxID=1737570 RepID=UPI001FE52820|nr:tRNA lysidine(34) synthetase TilS [Kandeliimicrobium roseum]
MSAPPPLAQRFAEAMGQCLGPDFPDHIGLAVSGGGDSMAMLHLAADWARVWGPRLHVVTVDHGLRAEAADEARLVAAEAEAHGLRHTTLRWQGWDGQGNLQDAARRARLALIGAWRGPVSHVLFAHTRDDQAETLLMRLARGSGVEGLSGMAPVQRVSGALTHASGGGPASRDWHIVRPLLDAGRDELRHYLKVLRIPHADDPSNDDPAYDRVRLRALLKALGAEGLDAARLSDTARRLRRAREALGRRALDAAEACLLHHPDGGPAQDPGARGSVLLDRDSFAGVEADTRLRVLAAALQFVASAEYRPREAALEAAMDRWLAGGTATLHGCTLMTRRGCLIVAREHAAVADLTEAAGSGRAWDARWILQPPDNAALSVRALGPEGLAQAKGWREATAMPRAALLSQPALWDGERLVACRAVGHGPDHRVALDPPGGLFPARLFSH